VAFRPRAADPSRAPAAPTPASGQPCGALGRAIARVFREGRPEVLALGPLCGESVVYLAGRGARVHVDEFEPPPPVPPRKPGEASEFIPPFRLEQPDRTFGLVLAFEVLDFVPPDRLADCGAELARVLRVGGQLFVFAHQKAPSGTAVIPRYRLLSDDLIVREEPEGGILRRRYVHPNRDIERALSGLQVQGIQLQRNQMREIVAVKSGTG
jgi:hypothetical protein